MTSNPLKVTFADVKDAHNRIAETVKKTPVFEFEDFNSRYGRNFFFKAENMQVTGSFKIRGALNAVLRLIERDSNTVGVVTHSSGNYGRAMAWITRRLGLKCCVVCPTTVPDKKLLEIKKLGAEIRSCQPTPADRARACKIVEVEKGYRFISTSDDYDVIPGQGTMALELLEQVPDLDAILVPVSGGGMLAGICVAAKAINPDIKIFAVEPTGKYLEDSLRAGERLWPNPPQCLDTAIDGMRMQQVGHKTWPIVLKLVEKDVFTVVSFFQSYKHQEPVVQSPVSMRLDKSDEEAIEGMKYAFNNMKLVIEISAGTSVAAAMSSKLQNMEPDIRNVGVILSGGNPDIDNLPWQQ